MNPNIRILWIYLEARSRTSHGFALPSALTARRRFPRRKPLPRTAKSAQVIFSVGNAHPSFMVTSMVTRVLTHRSKLDGRGQDPLPSELRIKHGNRIRCGLVRRSGPARTQTRVRDQRDRP